MKIMDVVNFIFVYILVWWVVIYTTLPFGNAPAERKDMEPGQASSAPANPRLKKKFIWTSIIAFVLTGAIFATLHYTGFTLFGPQEPWPQE